MGNQHTRQAIRNSWATKEEKAAQEEAKWFSLGKIERAAVASRMKDRFSRLATNEKVVDL